ncbi:hypothetical protein B0H14DRAFT_2708768 [Mycena olivaceomarginata]|nr:hypothetical protein B0H14DRAFT_2708768 [Mycena olivaceomarginata]
MIDSLAADHARIVDFDAQIQDLERSLSLLRGQRALVQERLDSYKYPVLTLPSDIICEIFIHFLPIYPSCSPVTGSRSPILLTHICGEWRKIALELPALWRALEIYWNETACLVPTLDRSGSSPLSIRMDERENRDRAFELGSAFLAALVPHCTRWQYLSLRLVGFPHRSSYPCIGGPMPLLQHLDLDLVICPDWPEFSFAEAPLLRTAILNDCAAAHIILPWTQLTSLTLKTVYLQECVPILQQAANLTHCELELLDEGFGPGFHGTNVGDVTLLFLGSLTLKDRNSDINDNYLQTFVAPALCSLEIPEGLLGSNPIDSLSSFISKSGCKLRRVQIIDRTELESSYHTAFPSIQMLLVDSDDGDGGDSESPGSTEV